jgi:hypothetical protein
METILADLSDGIARWTENPGLYTTAIPGLNFSHYIEPTQPKSGIYEPSICLVAQGAKRVYFGGDSYVYDAHHYSAPFKD